MKILIMRSIVLLGLSLILMACSSGEGETSPTPPPESVLTAAAQTADARLTELAKPDDSSTPSPLPTTNISPNTPTPTFSGTNLPITSSPEVTTSGVPTGGLDQAEYWADITVSDGTDFTPGEKFTKTWRLRNSGTSTWTPDYGLAFFNGAQMSGSTIVPLTSTVSPGATVDVSVDLIAPQSAGTYRGYWKMRNGLGEDFDYAVFVEIDVVGGTPSRTSTPQPPGRGRVTEVYLQVDEASANDCPHTFVFTATLTLSGPATVTYELEAGSDTPGFIFDLPGALTTAFDGGTHSLNYFLDIQDTVNGWAQLHVLEPNDKISNQVSFSLSCGS
jgi:hypothetical protein